MLVCMLPTTQNFCGGKNFGDGKFSRALRQKLPPALVHGSRLNSNLEYFLPKYKPTHLRQALISSLICPSSIWLEVLFLFAIEEAMLSLRNQSLHAADFYTSSKCSRTLQYLLHSLSGHNSNGRLRYLSQSSCPVVGLYTEFFLTFSY